MKYVVVFLFASMLSVSLSAQLNDYKYIIVPKKFESFKIENQYQTSTLVKYLFEKKGYNVVYEGDFPDDLANDLCLGAKVFLEDNSSLFRTKTVLVIKNCQSVEIFRTNGGTSKEKEYKKSYNEAIRGAFKSFDLVTYSYTPKETKATDEAVTVNYEGDVKNLPENEVMQVDKKEEMVTNEKKPASDQTVTVSFKNDVQVLPEHRAPEKEMVKQKATPEEQRYENLEPVPSNYKKAPSKEIGKTVDVLYAQTIEGGYQLVDSSPKIRYKLQKTSVDNVFLVEGEGVANGLLFKKDDQWILEGTATDGKKIARILSIKF